MVPDRASRKERAYDPSGLSDEQLQGPPARETTVIRSDRERAVEDTQVRHTASSPKLTGGDPDADWPRADSVGEEAVGGTVATPDQSVVDELGEALGVPHSSGFSLSLSGPPRAPGGWAAHEDVRSWVEQSSALAGPGPDGPRRHARRCSDGLLEPAWSRQRRRARKAQQRAAADRGTRGRPSRPLLDRPDVAVALPRRTSSAVASARLRVDGGLRAPPTPHRSGPPGGAVVPP